MGTASEKIRDNARALALVFAIGALILGNVSILPPSADGATPEIYFLLSGVPEWVQDFGMGDAYSKGCALASLIRLALNCVIAPLSLVILALMRRVPPKVCALPLAIRGLAYLPFLILSLTYDVRYASSGDPVWRHDLFWLALFVIPFVTMLVADLIRRDSPIRGLVAAVVPIIVYLVIALFTDYWTLTLQDLLWWSFPILAVAFLIARDSVSQANPAPMPTAAGTLQAVNSEQLLECKRLLDDGILTQEEFDAMKSRWLG